MHKMIDNELTPCETMDRNCTACRVITSDNVSIYAITTVLFEIYREFGDDVLDVIENFYPDLISCFYCSGLLSAGWTDNSSDNNNNNNNNDKE